MRQNILKDVFRQIRKTKSMAAVFVFLLACGVMTACSDDDKDEPIKGIVGEWISENSHLYYRFNSDGTGRYICLADEPGFNPSHPEISIVNPVDPEDFTYIIEGNKIVTKSTYNNHVYEEEYEYKLSDNVLQMNLSRSTDGNGVWHESTSVSWTTYLRWK